MRMQVQVPSQENLQRYLEPLRKARFSYAEVGKRQGELPEGYDVHANRFLLGEGEIVWQRAKAAIDHWQAFNTNWAQIFPERAPIEVGQAVAVSFRVMGVWWKNACRIVYTVDEDGAYGFAYGTLPGHVGHGEEYFGVERDADDRCWFVLKAYSQPAFWGVRLLPFVMRWQQQRFIRSAAVAMRKAVGASGDRETR